MLVVVDQELEHLAALALAGQARDVGLRLLDALVGPPREEARDARVAAELEQPRRVLELRVAERQRSARDGERSGRGHRADAIHAGVIAVLYDVHGNLAALDAVLEDAHAAGAEQWILGGDYALFGAWPAETVARLRELEPAVWVRGNVDRWAGDPAEAPDDAGIQEAIADCREALGDAVADELGALPFEAELAGARIVHASPVSDLRSFAPEPDAEDEELLDGTTHPRLLFGHTHVQFRRPSALGRPRARQPRLGRRAARRRPARGLRADPPRPHARAAARGLRHGGRRRRAARDVRRRARTGSR